ncbi:MAG: MerR family transcriptional regulator [Bacteroidales bacterium]|nr:MerR family transcriptional regulator [Bacteroidales bacterium]
MDGQYNIKDLESISGIQAHTIRIWEKRYGILKPERSENNFRHYDDEDLRYFLKLAFLNKNGIKISKLAAMSDDQVNDLVNDFQKPLNNHQAQIDSLIIAMISFDEEEIENIMQHLIMHKGLDEAMINIAFPFLNKIGILWSTGNISPVQEHFVANLIRQKIMAATDSISSNCHLPESKTFLLFTFPGDLHDIGLLFTNYLIRLNGFKTIYLGVSVPVNELKLIRHSINPKYIFTQSITHKSDDILLEGILEMKKIFDQTTILLGGNFNTEFENQLDSSTLIFDEFESLRHYLKQLSHL